MPPSQPPAPSTDQVAEDLRKVVGDLVRKVRSEADTPSSAQSETLGFIDRQGSASISEIAAFRHVKHQSMRLVVEQLEAQQWVSRMPDPTDGRRQLIALTQSGSAALQASRNQRSQWLATQLQQKASADELQTLRNAIEILGRLLTQA
ncbi:MAG: putative HTH-type transcriptional regulator [Pseudomonas sp.]|nr:MAG: putative HTH-type transcriptional regulator [Pseudomonas sp.]